MRDKSNQLLVVNTGRRKLGPDTDNQTTRKTGGSGGGVVGGSQYLLKEIWDKCWEIRTTDKGEEYLFGKLPIGLQFDLSSFVDGGLINLPTLYDGLPIDGQTLKWKEVTNEDGSVTRVLESVGGGGGAADKVTWANIEGKPTWIGESKPSYSWDDIENKPLWIDNSNKLVYGWKDASGNSQQAVIATEKWVGNNYLPLTGGTLTGDLRLKDSSNYGMTLFFGDDSYCYISEPSDDKMKIHASSGVTIETGGSYYVEIDSKGLKVNGGIITYNGSYWTINGDVLVTGGITSYE